MKKKLIFLLATLVLTFSVAVPSASAMNPDQQEAITRLQGGEGGGLATASHIAQLTAYFNSNPGMTRQQVADLMTGLQDLANFLQAHGVNVSSLATIEDLALALQRLGPAGITYLNSLIAQFPELAALIFPRTDEPFNGGTSSQGSTPTITLPNTGNNFTTTYLTLASVAILAGLSIFFATKKKAYETV